MAQAKSAAQALYPNLPIGTPSEVQQRQPNSIASAMWPSLSREAKRAEANQALWKAIHERQRNSFRQGWRRERGR
jgi:hypothetical protein